MFAIGSFPSTFYFFFLSIGSAFSSDLEGNLELPLLIYTLIWHSVLKNAFVFGLLSLYSHSLKRFEIDQLNQEVMTKDIAFNLSRPLIRLRLQ